MLPPEEPALNALGEEGALSTAVLVRLEHIVAGPHLTFCAPCWALIESAQCAMHEVCRVCGAVCRMHDCAVYKVQYTKCTVCTAVLCSSSFELPVHCMWLALLNGKRCQVPNVRYWMALGTIPT